MKNALSLCAISGSIYKGEGGGGVMVLKSILSTREA